MKHLLSMLFVLVLLGAGCLSFKNVEEPVSVQPEPQDSERLTELTQLPDETPTFSTVSEFAVSLGCPADDNMYPCLWDYAEQRGFDDYESFVMDHLSDSAKADPSYISQQAAVQAVNNTAIMYKLRQEYPAFWERVSAYTTREVKPLGKEERWFLLDETIQSIYDSHAETPTWQLLINCFEMYGCDRDAYLKALNSVVPSTSEDHSDLIFVVDAKTGKVLLYQRGLGKRGDATSFVTVWVPVKK